ncbi:MAG: MBL fold metallo-hydrolase [Pseudorhodobacter sp.]|nr:MBL fold metallo-hydrolase [Pseudorhodobacter sp.]
MKSPMISRRAILASAAALPLMPALGRPAMAAADMMGGSVPQFNRFKLGAFEVTALLAGTRTVEEPTGIFGLNADPEEFAKVSAEAFLPTDKAQFFFTPTVVNTGAELVLFDTGLNPDGITAALTAAGYSADQIDTVVLTHMHGDHIGGIAGDAGATFANAKIVTGAAEHNHWMGAGNEGFDAKVRPLNDKISFLDDGGSVTGGITAMAAFGHTPGHMTYRIESEGKNLLLMADLANHYVWSLAHPDWEVRFDMDKAAAAATRRKVLGMLAAERMPMIGYHMPFPALGYVETRGDGFHYVPASYQMML